MSDFGLLSRQIFVKLACGILSPGLAYVGIHIARECDRTVAEQLLRVFVRYVCFIKDSRKAVAELVGGDVMANLFTVVSPTHAVLHLRERLSVLSGEYVAIALRYALGEDAEQYSVADARGCLWRFNMRIVADELDGLGDVYHAVLSVYVIKPQRKSFTAPETGVQAYLSEQRKRRCAVLHGFNGAVRRQLSSCMRQVAWQLCSSYRVVSSVAVDDCLVEYHV